MSDGDFKQRRSRFRRHDHDTMRLTPDDRAIIVHVGLRRFLTTAHLFKLFPKRSQQNFRWRLARLFDAHYLDRPKAQVNHFSTTANSSMVHALGNKGAELFAHMQHATAPLTDWTDKNRSLTRPYIEHALLVADVMIALEPQLQSRTDLEVIRDAELRAALPPAIKRPSVPWSFSARLAHAGKYHTMSIAPDAAFALRFLDFGRRSFFFLEADRATMPIERSSLLQSSFKRKLQVYLAAHRANEILQRFGFNNLRVLTVTTSMERIQSMLAVVKIICAGKGQGMFLFTDVATLTKYSDPLTLPWITTTGPVRIDVAPRS